MADIPWALPAILDRKFVPRSVTRCAPTQFLLWLTPWFLLLALGLWASYLCLREGLFHTNMDNRFAFGLWIFLDLAIIAFGGGAFFSGVLLYFFKMKELNAVIRSAVLIGFLCYSGAVTVLAIDVGQPLRAWFTFWHPNTHSMLTEVTFCITAYLVVLAVEYLPVLLRNRQVRKIPSFLVFEWELHKLIPVLAAIGAFLSFFHQGSLGGLYGVLAGRPFAFRESFGIWPTTFFLFVLSAMAVGPSFLLLTTRAAEWISGRSLVLDSVYLRLARVSGCMLACYVLLKSADTLVWLNVTSRRGGFLPWEYYSWQPFGVWILFAEIALFGLLPAVWLLRARQGNTHLLIVPALLACLGVALNRYVLTVQTLSLPTLPFDEFLSYSPSWQEYAVFGGVVAYGVIVYSIFYRYTRLFPQEREG